jgi:hypothetical protein
MSRNNPTVRLEPRVYDVVDEISRTYGANLTAALTLLIVHPAIREEYLPRVVAAIPQRASRRRKSTAESNPPSRLA